MTDSGGIQEEGVSIGKPVLILRENTERPEAIKSGNAVLAGTSFNKIYYFSSSLLKNKEVYHQMAKAQYIYGKGNSRIIISQIIQNYFQNNIQNLNRLNKLNYSLILSQYDNSIHQCNNSIFPNSNEQYEHHEQYDLVIVLTVWKRKNLERQLFQVKNQSILKNKTTNLIIFQNSNHIDVTDIINKWKNSDKFSSKVDISFVQSPIETGYFGRFIIPLTSSVRSNSYFIICDDDIIWGKRYFENMLRVVDEGSLATRNGRIITQNYKETSPASKAWTKNIQVCYNEDIEYDFGGHIWSGRISWLRNAWKHIPISLDNSEDFWLSATLKTFYNISTKTPKCPCPKDGPVNPDLCAASDKSAKIHTNNKIGKNIIDLSIRAKLIKAISLHLKYKPIIFSDSNALDKINKQFIIGNKDHPLFNLSFKF
jgi:hypothetical protein